MSSGGNHGMIEMLLKRGDFRFDYCGYFISILVIFLD